MQTVRSDDSRRGPITHVQAGTVSAVVDTGGTEKVTSRPQSADFAEQYDDLV